MKNFFISLIYIFFLPTMIVAKSDNENLLKELDEVISNKKYYHKLREDKISHFKDSLRKSGDVKEKYDLCGALFYEYLHYQADSSLYYINMKHSYLPQMNKPELEDEILINRAEVFGVMGMYNEAEIELNKVKYYINMKHSYLPQMNKPELEDEILINRAEVFGVMGMYNEAEIELNKVNLGKITNPGLIGYYYRTRRAYYGWLADYTADIKASKYYKKITETYRDSISMMKLPDMDSQINNAEELIINGEFSRAINLLLSCMQSSKDMKRNVYANYTLSEAYEALGDTTNQIKYLAITAIKDIKMAEREYASLQKLAYLIYQQGDLDRAYRYLTCSMEDAVASNARLRFLEVTQIYPIIDKAYKKKEAEKKKYIRRLLIGISILAFLLIIATFYLYYWMKKLSVMRRNLYHANKKLVEANRSLTQTGKIKEVYIAKYLDRCVIYLEKLEQYRRSLEKLAMASKIDQLFKAIKSEEFLRDERKMFYDEFDRSFLDLFPNFVEDFNNLLTDDARIYPKKDEHLNTELRIFALIRLGVKDANHIAHFLGYSLATVYNYRSKIRNKAKGNKDNFEQDVMNL